MNNRSDINSVDCAPPTSYQLLSAMEFASRRAGMAREGSETYELLSPLVINTSSNSTLDRGHPAFQLDPRLNRATLSKLRQLFKSSGASETSLWDFLRTRHKSLGGATGVDFLLGFPAPEIASFSASEREEHVLDLAGEEIWRLRQ